MKHGDEGGAKIERSLRVNSVAKLLAVQPFVRLSDQHKLLWRSAGCGLILHVLVISQSRTLTHISFIRQALEEKTKSYQLKKLTPSHPFPHLSLLGESTSRLSQTGSQP